MKFKKIFLFLLMIGLLFIVGCNGNYKTVTFDSNGGSKVESVKVEAGKTIDEPVAPTRGEDEFLGWYLNGELFSFTTPITENITLKARWSNDGEIFYIVKFYSFDGELIDSQRVREGESAVAPNAPTIEGYIFTGWDVDFSNVTANIEVNAIYEVDDDYKKSYVVTFYDFNGVTISKQEVEQGSSAVAPKDPTRDGYIFVGWDKDFTNVTKRLDIRAKYIKEGTKFDIIYNLNGGSFGYSSKDEYVLAFLNDFYKFVNATESLDQFIYGNSKTEFKGTWKKYIGGTVGEVNKLLYNNNLDLDNDNYFFNSKTYKAKWANLGLWVKSQNNRFAGTDYEYGALDFYRYIINDPDKYIDVYGDKFYGYPKVNEPTKLTFEYSNNSIKLHNPLSTAFKGWYLNSNFDGEPVTEIPANTYKDFEVYAKWDNTVTYELYFNTGTDTKLDPITFTYGQTITLPTVERVDYTFIGWYLGTEKVENPFTVDYNRSITLDAHWRSNKVELVPLKYDGKSVTYRNSNTEVLIPNNYVQPDRQLRAAWVSSFVSDFAPSTSEATMKNNLLGVLDLLESYNMNCIIFHIRTMNNAFYKTKLAPIASEYGTYSSFEEWDYLTWFISECHKRGMEFHAWLNPYRIRSYGYSYSDTTQTVANSYKDYPLNPAHNPDNILMTNHGETQGAILNPAKTEVQDYIVKVCLEVMENYDVDAIHFDDYFYAQMSPTDDILNQPDQSDYKEYIKNHPNSFNVNNRGDKADWRRMNVDNFIKKLSDSMRDFNRRNHKKVQLGISPTGIYKNGNGSANSGSNTAGQEHYASYLFCDSLKWVRNEWIDYILPQSYWGFTHRVAGYADVMDWWNKAVDGTRVNLYSGIGLYMAEPNKNYSWGTQHYEVSNQILYTTKLSNVKGVSFFALKNIRNYSNNTSSVPYKGLMRLKDEYWTTKVKTPETIASRNFG